MIQLNTLLLPMNLVYVSGGYALASTHISGLSAGIFAHDVRACVTQETRWEDLMVPSGLQIYE